MKILWSIFPKSGRSKPPQRFLIGERIYIARVGFLTIVEFVMPGAAPHRADAARRLEGAGGNPETHHLVASLLRDESLQRLKDQAVPGPLYEEDEPSQPDDVATKAQVVPHAVQSQAQIDMFGGAA